ncbi:MmgE/PrpD family protein [Sodalis ligni]|uniref:MmgE/PrpD family protein n=1 Tax=Sodalis ligni TaxID=2697027 RepID=UPI00193FDE88|nr:MmgE/PrpD family protein [Sodalis ligni]QWA10924.1 MmgE/PrpD family protein [Sodalis ligni]
MSLPDSQQASNTSDEGVTRALARYLVTSRPGDLPENVRAHGICSFVNWLGCAVGGSRHPAVDIAYAALSPFAGAEQAALLGRNTRTDIITAALLNGIASHVFDFDDTHLKTVIHPAGPVASAIMALSEFRGISGADFIHALVLGIETECRIGNAVYPDHYDIGWHITGTAGVFGAAAAVGKLLALDEQQMVWALGLAASQPVGLREMFGTMTKSFHPGRAAQNGLTAALLAAKGYTSSEQGIEAKRGWANVTSTHRNLAEITGGLGERHESLLNTFKPFACGIVIHPVIDGCIQLRSEYALQADEIDSIELRVHPLVLELTGKRTPKTGLDGKFSVYHSAAVAVIQGRAGEAQYSDASVRDEHTIGLRDRVNAVIDPSLDSDAAHIVIRLHNGQRLEKHVDHAIGSAAKPMTRQDLNTKFTDLVAPILGQDRAAILLRACWDVESCRNMAELSAMTQEGGR